MGVIFKTAVGRAVAYTSESLSVNFGSNNFSSDTSGKRDARDVANDAANAAGAAWNNSDVKKGALGAWELFKRGINPVGNWIDAIKDLASKGDKTAKDYLEAARTALGGKPLTTEDIGWEPTPPVDSIFSGIPGTVSVKLGFSEGKYGFVLGMEGSFQDSAGEDAGPSEDGVLQGIYTKKMGRFRVSGIAFADVCGESGGRHGLEDVFNFYWHKRVSNERYSAERRWQRLRLGQTVFKQAWIVGMDFMPHDMNFNIWRWTLHYLVNPNYYPQPLPGSNQ